VACDWISQATIPRETSFEVTALVRGVLGVLAEGDLADCAKLNDDWGLVGRLLVRRVQRSTSSGTGTDSPVTLSSALSVGPRCCPGLPLSKVLVDGRYRIGDQRSGCSSVHSDVC
jgi:hypothetical protein